MSTHSLQTKYPVSAHGFRGDGIQRSQSRTLGELVVIASAASQITTSNVVFEFLVCNLLVLLLAYRLKQASHEIVPGRIVERVRAIWKGVVNELALSWKDENGLSGASIVDKVDDVDQDVAECLKTC